MGRIRYWSPVHAFRVFILEMYVFFLNNRIFLLKNLPSHLTVIQRQWAIHGTTSVVRIFDWSGLLYVLFFGTFTCDSPSPFSSVDNVFCDRSWCINYVRDDQHSLCLFLIKLYTVSLVLEKILKCWLSAHLRCSAYVWPPSS